MRVAGKNHKKVYKCSIKEKGPALSLTQALILYGSPDWTRTSDPRINSPQVTILLRFDIVRFLFTIILNLLYFNLRSSNKAQNNPRTKATVKATVAQFLCDRESDRI